MNFRQWLESPISNIQTIGQWGPEDKPRGYDQKSIGILQSNKALEKIKKQWSNTKNEFIIYFFRGPKPRDVLGQEGEVNTNWLKEKLNLDIQPQSNAITIVFINNVGVNKVPMTAWVIAHRLGHVLFQFKLFEEKFWDEIKRDLREIIRYVYIDESRRIDSLSREYGDIFRGLVEAIGTMKSAREGKLSNPYEFVFELVAQYIITGKIKFNPLPKSIITQRRYAWGNEAHSYKRATVGDEDLAEWSAVLQNHADKYTYYLQTIFDSIEGKIFVM